MHDFNIFIFHLWWDGGFCIKTQQPNTWIFPTSVQIKTLLVKEIFQITHTHTHTKTNTNTLKRDNLVNEVDPSRLSYGRAQWGGRLRR